MQVVARPACAGEDPELFFPEDPAVVAEGWASYVEGNQRAADEYSALRALEVKFTPGGYGHDADSWLRYSRIADLETARMVAHLDGPVDDFIPAVVIPEEDAAGRYRTLSDFGNRQRVRQAKAICARCDLRSECLMRGLHEPFGIWGGKTERERSKLRGDLVGRAA